MYDFTNKVNTTTNKTSKKIISPELAYIKEQYSKQQQTNERKRFMVSLNKPTEFVLKQIIKKEKKYYKGGNNNWIISNIILNEAKRLGIKVDTSIEYFIKGNKLFENRRDVIDAITRQTVK